LRIACTDALQAYRDLSDYQITLMLQADGWHVDFNIMEPLVAGGGPSYVIDGSTGTILSKCYYQ
jgi:hypothetical protein